MAWTPIYHPETTRPWDETTATAGMHGDHARRGQTPERGTAPLLQPTPTECPLRLPCTAATAELRPGVPAGGSAASSPQTQNCQRGCTQDCRLVPRVTLETVPGSPLPLPSAGSSPLGPKHGAATAQPASHVMPAHFLHLVGRGYRFRGTGSPCFSCAWGQWPCHADHCQGGIARPGWARPSGHSPLASI